MQQAHGATSGERKWNVNSVILFANNNDWGLINEYSAQYGQQVIVI